MPLKTPVVSPAVAREMLGRAQAALSRTYPVPSKGYAATALGAAGAVYEGVSYCSDTQTVRILRR